MKNVILIQYFQSLNYIHNLIIMHSYRNFPGRKDSFGIFPHFFPPCHQKPWEELNKGFLKLFHKSIPNGPTVCFSSNQHSCRILASPVFYEYIHIHLLKNTNSINVYLLQVTFQSSTLKMQATGYIDIWDMISW